MGNETKPTRTPTYAALITISLPGGEQTASAAVVLSEGDTIPDAGGAGRKPLRDCTLADLETFANQLEAEVWETYQAIRLIELEENEKVEVDVTLMGETGDIPLIAWDNWSVKLIEQEAEETISSDLDTPPPPPETDESESHLAGETAVTEEAPTSQKTEPPTAEPAEQAAAPEAEKEAAAEIETKPAPETEMTAAETAEEVEAALRPPQVAVETEPEEAAETEVTFVLSPEELTALVQEGGLPSRPQVRIAGERLVSDHPTDAAPNIFIAEPALRAAQGHALSSLSREVAGVLVGPRPEKQPDGRYDVYVTDTIIAKHTVMHGASVTYTPESWRYLNDQLEERYPDETAVMVGWYHTHPGFGIFLSGMDQFIHRNFFTQIWHVALVLDPVAHSQGFFSWDREQTAVSRYPFPWPRWAGQW